VVEAAEHDPVRDDADIVHIQHQYFFFGGVAPWKNRFGAFARRLTRPTVMTVHEFVEPIGPPHVRAAIRITNRVQFARRQIDALLVHTEEDRRRMMASGFGGKKIEVVRHGVPARPPLPSALEAKRALGLDGRFVVTLFGFLSRRKGHGIAIEAMRHLQGNVNLLLAGGRHPNDTSDYPEMVERMVSSCEINDRVRITGYLAEEDVYRVMAATDVVIAPFTESSGSGSLALAFACGKLIVASDIGPHREIEQGAERTIRLVENEPEAYAEEIRHLMDNPDDRVAQEARAVAYAAAHSYGRMADETIAVYGKVLDRPAP
jgi:glycosyltransferase involved in cell wall biosynthesis